MARRNRAKFQASGLLVVDKPGGVSSTQVLNQIKKLTQPEKIGHTGTLDPFATGVLVVCFNQATKLSGYLMEGDKVYQGVMYLGIETDTQDLTGQMVRRRPVKTTPDGVLVAAEKFKGEIKQKPPAYSALKQNGERLYAKARRGEQVEVDARTVVVHSLGISSIDLPRVHFEVRCSKGTYIRTLAHDWGRALGCGGHLESLRRIQNGPFSVEQALLIGQVESLIQRGTLADRLIPPQKGLDWPQIQLTGQAVEMLSYGRALASDQLGESAGGNPPLGLKVQLIDPDGNLAALAEVVPGDDGNDFKVQPLRLLMV